MKKYITPEMVALTYGVEETIAAPLPEGSKHFNDAELEW